MSIRTRLAKFIAGDYIEDEIERATLAIMEDWWAKTDQASSTQDMSWHERTQYLDDALEAWSINPYARRIVNLHTSYVVGRKLSIGSSHKDINQWVKRWWLHPKNRVQLEIYNWSDELTRAGELFFTLHTNKHDGMQYVRAIPARRITNVETADNDYKKELVYHELVGLGGNLESPHLETKPWLSWEHPDVINDPTTPCMVHYATNRPVGAVRSHGGDLNPMLPWVRRYTEWLKNRVRINKNRNAWAWKMTAASKDRVAELEEKYRDGLTAGSVWIGMADEDLDAVSARIDAGDAREDGRALRQVLATGGNVAPHMLGDTDDATRATATAANEPTFHFWAMRQLGFIIMLKDVAQISATRAHRAGKFRRWLPKHDEWGWTHEASDLTRGDNQALASATKTIVDAMATMADRNWIDRETAVGLAIKFAGEALDPQDIIRRVDEPPDLSDLFEREKRFNAQANGTLMGR